MAGAPEIAATEPGGTPGFAAALDMAVSTPRMAVPSPTQPVAFIDPLSLAEWWLTGTSTATQLEPPAKGKKDDASGEAPEPAPATHTDGGDWWDVPVDALVIPIAPALAPVPTPPDVVAAESGSTATSAADVRVDTVAAGATTPQPQTAPAGVQQTAVPVPRFPALLQQKIAPAFEAGSESPGAGQTVVSAPTGDDAAAIGPELPPPAAAARPAKPARPVDVRAEAKTLLLNAAPIVTRDSAAVETPVATAAAADAAVEAKPRVAAAVTVAPSPAPAANILAFSRPFMRQGGEDSGAGANRHAFAAAVKQIAWQPEDRPAAFEPALSRSVAAPTPAPARQAPLVTATTAAQDSSPTGATLPEQDSVTRFIQTFRVQARNGLTEATVRLKPEHLGEVSIAVRVDRGSVTAVVNAADPGVRQWLRGQEDTIRATLAEQGLTLESLVVDSDGERQDQGAAEQETQRRQRAPRRQGDEPRFEMVA